MRQTTTSALQQILSGIALVAMIGGCSCERFTPAASQGATTRQVHKIEEPQTDGSSRRIERMDLYPPPVAIVKRSQGGPDGDGDGLSDALERSLGTDSSDPDTDRDGIRDGWEAHGTHGCELVPSGCDPLRKDLLIEIDYHHYRKGDRLHSARLSDTVVRELVRFFAELKISNPNPQSPIAGKHGIRLHLVHDDEHVLGLPDGKPDKQSNTAHDCYFNRRDSVQGDHSSSDFPVETFRKATLCIGEHSWQRGGNAHFGGRTLKLSRPEVDRDPTNDRTEPMQLRWYVGFIHELGHGMGLRHGGRRGPNFKPNYHSVMSYRYGASAYQNLQSNQVQFSSGELIAYPLDTCAIEETRSFPGLTMEDVQFLTLGKQPFEVLPGDGSGPHVDWNRDGQIQKAPYRLSLTGRKLKGCDRQGKQRKRMVLRDHDDLALIQQCLAAGISGNPRAPLRFCKGRGKGQS